MKKFSTIVVVPAYNEAKVISSVIQGIKKQLPARIIVVDDGSTDDTLSQAAQAGAITLRHKINRGKGAATKTGLEAAKLLQADIIVTMDGDGQHNPADLPHLIKPIASGQSDVALGTRVKDRHSMPLHRQLANHLANFFTWLIYGLWVQDSQSGFRAFSRRAAEMIDTRSDNYEYESEVIKEIRSHKLSYREVPIHVRYSKYSMKKLHRQSFINGLKTLYKMIWNRLS